MIQDHDHIPTAEIERDIADTEREIDVMKKELLGYETFPFSSSEFRMAQIKISVRKTGIKEREDFIAKLRQIIADRSAQPEPEEPKETQ